MQTKDLLKTALDFFIPKNTEKKTGLLNRTILKEMEECFEKTIEEQSMRGRMLYDSNFTIALHPDDFEDRKQTLPYVVQMAVNGFYEIITKNKKHYGNAPFVPATKNWYFQFLSKEKLLDNEIKRGEVMIMSTFASPKKTSGSNGNVVGTIRITFKPNLSKYYESLNIDLQLLSGLGYEGGYIFTPKFDINLGTVTYLPKSVADSTLAALKYTVGGHEIEYSMSEPEIIISKKRSDNTYPANTLAIDSDFLVDQHARIKYEAHTNQFFIAAFADTKVDQRNVVLSNGGDVNWVRLDKNATLLLNLYSIKFSSLV